VKHRAVKKVKWISYYTANKGHVFCTLLDATKAFDRVQYCKLFSCLMDRKLPFVVLCLLCKFYTSHVTCVLWNGSQSNWFGVINGVKQGGVLSPVLFCVYLDRLLKVVCSPGAGCFIGAVFTGILAYADDIVLLAPTPQVMRRMLVTCEDYAAEFCTLFNASKSKCIICMSRPRSRSYDFINDVKFTLNGNAVKSWPHLGHIIHM